MQGYTRSFARIYNQRWAGFAQRVAPLIRAYYERAWPDGPRSLLDLCCGTGQLARHFLDRGYQVVGIDLSEHMLQYARENAAPYVAAGQVTFIQGDAAHFSLDDRVGLAVSTFDALNHLPGEAALRSCFDAVYRALDPGGTFIFDLNTRQGLLAHWNGVQVQDTEELMLVTRGIYDPEQDRAWTRITGFSRREDGLYERFEQTAYNSAFDLSQVSDMLLEAGWGNVHFAHVEDLVTPIQEPEGENRTFVVARKPSLTNA
jgi:SAM-dependent methyltransferase